MKYTVQMLGLFEFGSWNEATVESNQGSDHDEMDRPNEEERRRS